MTTPTYLRFSELNRTNKESEDIFKARIDDAIDIYNRYKSGFFNRDCPVCGSSDYTNLEKFYDSYDIARCNTCNSSYVNPCPPEKALEDYYNNAKCNNLVGSLLISRVGAQKAGQVSEKVLAAVSIVEEALAKFESISVLEVACNSGVFLSDLKNTLSDRGLLQRVTLHGIDIDKNAINNSVDDELSLEACSASEFLEKNNQRFEVVLHFELIEHLSNPSEFMDEIYSLMVDGGLHYFHTPNGNGFENLAVGYNQKRPIAHSIYPPMHLQAFTIENILHFALRHKFKLQNIETPGGLDVDIVKQAAAYTDDVFAYVDHFSEAQLAIVQAWLVKLKASTHMRVKLIK